MDETFGSVRSMTARPGGELPQNIPIIYDWNKTKGRALKQGTTYGGERRMTKDGGESIAGKRTDLPQTPQ